MTRLSTTFDAIVIGGGPAGATAALLLASRGWSVAVVEAKSFPRRKVCGEYLSATNWPLLDCLGLLDQFRELAGPPVRKTAICAGAGAAYADLPLPRRLSDEATWGRALSREKLDAMLLARATALGAKVHQPARCVQIRRVGDQLECEIENLSDHSRHFLRTRVMIAAHGSWEIGALATQRRRAPQRPGDLLAFKAHFRGASLEPGLMPLLSFPDGYGGMTHCDDGRVSLSCCIRRDRLNALQRGSGDSAGETVLWHILEHSPVLRPVLEPRVLDGKWLSAGPIQPGIRSSYEDGVFVIGNAAGEAHPVVAEGISMAMQSAWLLCDRLGPLSPQRITETQRRSIASSQQAAWRRAFAPRIAVAATIAHWAMRPKLVAPALPLLRGWPSLLTLGARLSGKSQLVVEGPIVTSPAT
jgi:menaquinone-9 beta-reductase